MSILNVPVTATNMPYWVRRVADAINQLIGAVGAVSAGGVPDGDYGDIVVSGTSTVFSFDSSVVTAFARTFLDDATAGDVRTTIGAAATSHTHAYTDIGSVPTGTIFYRKTAGTGAAETQTLATLKTDLALTGTNSGDQTITLTGDVTGAGTGSFAATIANAAVTLAKIANAAASSKLVGSGASGSGSPYAELSLGPILSMSGTTISAAPNRAVTTTLVNNTSATTIPFDNTIPQIGEGVEILTLSITPTSSTARLRVEAVIPYGVSVALWCTLALFVNGGSNAVQVKSEFHATSGGGGVMVLVYEYVPGSTSSQTISLRAGPHTAGTLSFNAVGSVTFGGVNHAQMIATEVA